MHTDVVFATLKTYPWIVLGKNYLSLIILQLVSANVSTMGKSPLLLDDTDLPLKVTFTYSAKWFKSS